MAVWVAGRMKVVVISTVATGRNAPKADHSAMTIAVSANAISAWPATILPGRSSCSSKGMTSVADSSVVSRTFRFKANIHGGMLLCKSCSASSTLMADISVLLSRFPEAEDYGSRKMTRSLPFSTFILPEHLTPAPHLRQGARRGPAYHKRTALRGVRCRRLILIEAPSTAYHRGMLIWE